MQESGESTEGEVLIESVDDDCEYHTLEFIDRMWAYIYTVPDLRGGRPAYAPGHAATYGRTKDEGLEDYYVGISESMNGAVGMRDIGWGHFYPERVFVWGQDEDGDPLKRSVVREYLQAMGLRSNRDFWNPCQVWRGFSRGDVTWHNALRADANLGIRWHDVTSRRQALPAGWEMDFRSGTNSGYILIPTKKTDPIQAAISPDGR